jgi:pyroglutamyl-peptidase
MTPAKSDQPSSTNVSFVVTGFGPFQNIKDNPTTVIAEKLTAYVKDKDLLLTTLVIETSAEAAQQETDQLRERFHAEQKNGITVVLHMGVNFSGTHFQLEQWAYNEAHFRIPDEKGYQPCNKKVIDGCEPTLMTQLDVEQIRVDIGLESVVVSTDPGRFVCNYTYYCSLSKFQKAQGVYSLFLHVPPFSVVPEEEQLRIVTLVLEAIRKQFL